jgi:hypothetical protein
MDTQLVDASATRSESLTAPALDASGNRAGAGNRIFKFKEIRPGTWTYELDRAAFHRASPEELRQQWVELASLARSD